MNPPAGVRSRGSTAGQVWPATAGGEWMTMPRSEIHPLLGPTSRPEWDPDQVRPARALGVPWTPPVARPESPLLVPPSLERLHGYTGWRNDWSHIVAGN